MQIFRSHFGSFFSASNFICTFSCIFREDYRWIKANQKKKIIDCISENILDQNDDSILAAMMSAFDLSSEEGYESWIEKISFLYDCYGIDYVHTLDEKW